MECCNEYGDILYVDTSTC